MKKIIGVVLFILLLAACNPVENGVYFEIGGNNYTVSEEVYYGYESDDSALPDSLSMPIVFFAYTSNSLFNFHIFTYNFNQGTVYFTNGVAGVGITVKNEIMAPMGDYHNDISLTSTDNCLQILSFNQDYVEFKYSAVMTNGIHSFQLKNGYLKLAL